MRRIGLVVGCSHSAGSEIDGSEDSEYNRLNSFGSLLSIKLDREPVNISLSGAANSGIARSVIKWFDSEYDPDTMDVFVCIGWTESSRLEIPNPSDYTQGNLHTPWYDKSANSFWRINFGWEGGNAQERRVIPTYHKFMAENPLLLETWASKDVLMTQYFLGMMNIPYVMCNTMHMFQENEHFTGHTVKMIDETKYYGLYDEGFYWKYRNMGHENPKAKYWHHSEEPHRLHAEELYKFVTENQNV